MDGLAAFSKLLKNLEPGGSLSLSYAMYELLFPPGEEAPVAFKECLKFAGERDCTVKINQEKSLVEFSRRKPVKARRSLPVSA